MAQVAVLGRSRRFMVLPSVALTAWVSPYFIWPTVSIGFNMIQSAFTVFCQAAVAFRRLRVSPGAAF